VPNDPKDHERKESSEGCDHPRVEIDALGQRLHGCVQCNRWINADGEWLRLAEEDIAALRGLSWQRAEFAAKH